MPRARRVDRTACDNRSRRELERAIPVRHGHTAAGADMAGESEHRVRAELSGDSWRDPSDGYRASGSPSLCQAALDVLRQIRDLGDTLAGPGQLPGSSVA